MLIETERLVIRDVTEEDGPAFAEMAADGSLKDIGFDRDYGEMDRRGQGTGRSGPPGQSVSGLYGCAEGRRYRHRFCGLFLL